MVQLTGRLEALRARPDERPIANLAGYVAVMAYHACDHYVRRKRPARWRLKNRLRYALTQCRGAGPVGGRRGVARRPGRVAGEVANGLAGPAGNPPPPSTRGNGRGPRCTRYARGDGGRAPPSPPGLAGPALAARRACGRDGSDLGRRRRRLRGDGGSTGRDPGDGHAAGSASVPGAPMARGTGAAFPPTRGSPAQPAGRQRRGPVGPAHPDGNRPAARSRDRGGDASRGAGPALEGSAPGGRGAGGEAGSDPAAGDQPAQVRPGAAGPSPSRCRDCAWGRGWSAPAR